MRKSPTASNEAATPATRWSKAREAREVAGNNTSRRTARHNPDASAAESKQEETTTDNNIKKKQQKMTVIDTAMEEENGKGCKIGAVRDKHSRLK